MKMELLTKILGMTGSEHDGEALAALRKAQGMMREAKVTWADLLKAPSQSSSSGYQQQQGSKNYYQPPPPPPPRPPPPPPVDDVVERAFALMDEFPEKLTEWEEDFLLSRSEYEWSDYMSDKQRAIMERLATRYDMLKRRG